MEEQEERMLDLNVEVNGIQIPIAHLFYKKDGTREVIISDVPLNRATIVGSTQIPDESL